LSIVYFVIFISPLAAIIKIQPLHIVNNQSSTIVNAAGHKQAPKAR
jgi:hypothetical protein